MGGASPVPVFTTVDLFPYPGTELLYLPTRCPVLSYADAMVRKQRAATLMAFSGWKMEVGSMTVLRQKEGKWGLISLRSAALSAYALAMQCPVLRYHMMLCAYALAMQYLVLTVAYDTICLRACYAMSGTQMMLSAHTAICLHAMSGTSKVYGATNIYPIRCPVLMWRIPYVYGATSEPLPYSGTASSDESWYSLRVSYAISGTELAYRAIGLRVSYEMSGTDIARGAIVLRARHAMSSTDTAYGAVCLRACYAMSGTDMCVGDTAPEGYTSLGNVPQSCYAIAMQCPVLTSALPIMRRLRYAMPSTDAGYHPTPSLWGLLCGARVCSYAVLNYAILVLGGRRAARGSNNAYTSALGPTL
eukprot:1666245-Rhodomonas_salina.2